MFFSNEMIEKARTASSAAELLEMAKANGVELSAEDAEMYFDFLTKKNGPLSDDELGQVAGGKGSAATLPAPKYAVPQTLWYHFPNGDLEFVVRSIDHYSAGNGWFYTIEFLETKNTQSCYLEINENVYKKEES